MLKGHDRDHQPKLGPNDHLIDDQMAAALVPRRDFGAHKWGVGGLVVVAGSPGFAGAAALCALAAGRAGAGIVNVAVPHGLASVITSLVPDAALILLPSGESVASGRRAVELIGAKLERAVALVVGPGLGQDETADALLQAVFGMPASRAAVGFGIGGATSTVAGEGFLARINKPVVIDADGLNWLAGQPSWWERLPAGRAVLTPHVGEMARLLGVEPAAVTSDPLATVREAAARWQQTVVLKYGYTAASDGKESRVAADAPASLATAGSGDVLTGVIGAFLAQGVAPLDAAALAIHVGMRAARQVEARTGELGLLASDLPLAIAGELAALGEMVEANGG